LLKEDLQGRREKGRLLFDYDILSSKELCHEVKVEETFELDFLEREEFIFQIPPASMV
jgi:hypothetical protein